MIALNDPAIMKFTEKGIKTKNEGEMEFDAIKFATGFDAITGGMTQIDIKGTTFVMASPSASAGRTRVPIPMSGRVPQIPQHVLLLRSSRTHTAFSNGPTCVEIQGEWADRLTQDMKREGKTRVEPTRRLRNGGRNRLMLFGTCLRFRRVIEMFGILAGIFLGIKLRH